MTLVYNIIRIRKFGCRALLASRDNQRREFID